MTTPGAIGDQAAVPSNVGVGRLRDPGTRSDGAAAATDDAQAGFDDVLKTLQKDDGRPILESSDGPKTSTRTGLPQSEGAAGRTLDDDASPGLRPPGPTKYVVYDNLDLGDEQTQSAGEEALPDDARGAPQESDASGVRDIAAIVGLVVFDAPVGNATATPKRATDDAAEPAAQAKVVLDQVAAGGQRDPAVADGAAHDLYAARNATAETDTLAHLSSALGSTEADKIGRSDKGRKITIETSASAPSEDETSALPADVGTPSQPLKARVVSQETHFAPVTRSSPELQTGDFATEKGKPELGTEAPGSQSAPSVAKVLPSGGGALAFAASPASQIADHVIAAAPTSDPVRQAGAAPEMAAMKPTIKVLSIQLQPADLGTITVRMELKDAELKLHVEADRADTADLIRGDQDTLSRLLRSSGFAIDPSAIRVVEGDRVAASQQLGQQGTQTNLQSSPQWQFGSSERHGHGQRGSTGANDGDTSPKSSRNDSNEKTTNRGGRGLVV